jgi:hypothetical protein
MVEIFVQPLVGAFCLIVFHIPAVMDSPDHCADHAHLHATFTFSNVGIITYYHSKLLENPSVTSGGYPPKHNTQSFEAGTAWQKGNVEK